MTDAKHTPGPWTIGAFDPATNARFIYGPDNWSIARVSDSPLNANGEANAALIARAPEMAAEIERLTALRDSKHADVLLLREECSTAWDLVEKLRAQNAELVAALEQLLNANYGQVRNTFPQEAAIAKGVLANAKVSA